MKKIMALLTLMAFSSASAGDWGGTLLDTLGAKFPGATRLDYSDPDRWELKVCEKVNAYLSGRLNRGEVEAGAAATFITPTPMTDAQFWNTVNKIKNKTEPFPFGKEKVTYNLKKTFKTSFPLQEIEESVNFKGRRIFLAVGNHDYKPVLCVVMI